MLFKSENRPVIGFSTPTGRLHILHRAVCFALWLTGAKPQRLTAETPHIDDKLSRINGLVICGGSDVYPARYKQNPAPLQDYDEPRDDLEIKALEHCEQTGKPVLGICRGAQLMNVVRGGTLHMDISKVFKEANYPNSLLAYVFFRKWITVKKDSFLAGVIKSKRVRVNSMHKQAIDKVGQGLRVSAKEQNGIVQAIEDPTCKFFLGVQYHPEVLLYSPIHIRIFRHLVRAAKGEDMHPR